jgi:starch phosphorylase
VPVEEIPIDSITNGVHIKSWLSEELNVLFERYLGPGWQEEPVNSSVWNYFDSIPDEELWRPHLRSKVGLIAFTRSRLKAQMQRRGTYHTELNWAEEVLDPEALTIGFARRFASYKRGALLLRDPQRLIKLLSNTERPVQIVFAGKAHPRDAEGKEIIRQIIHFASQYNVRRRIAFLEDYDMNVARYMVRGVDIWLNNPRRPLEASGTSGMKAALNGALNLSTLDGWWCEGYKPEGGWIIGAGETYEDLNYQDSVESQAIYNLLENEVVPLYYTRSADQLPRAWIARMKNSMKWITPRFNTFRMFKEYTEKFYCPAAIRWNNLTEENHARAKALSSWNAQLKNAWGGLSILDVDVRLHGRNGDGKLEVNRQELKVGAAIDVKALIKLGRVKPEDIAVQLYNGPLNPWGGISQGSTITMKSLPSESESSDNQRWFSVTIPCDRSGQMGLAVRIVPKNQDLANPWDPGLVLWESPLSKS